MRVSVASSAEGRGIAVKTLGLSETADIFSPEGLAASLRRAASFLCPAAPRQIIDAVLDALQPLRPDATLPRTELAGLLDLLISAGDLLELRQSADRPSRLLYLGPPSYVAKHPGRYLILGIRPFGAPLIGSSLAGMVRYVGHTRTIDIEPATAESQLSADGLHKIRGEQWVSHPAEVPADTVIAQVRQRLAVAGPAGEVQGLTILDPSKKVTYYRERWRAPKPADAGDFVARRPQAYGADLWCVVRLVGGAPQRLIDLPVEDAAAPGHDEAWRIQAAVDAARGSPQLFRVHAETRALSDMTVDFFSPLPRWAQRYLELVGTVTQRAVGALFSYQVPAAALPAISGFLVRMLWMSPHMMKEHSDG